MSFFVGERFFAVATVDKSLRKEQWCHEISLGIQRGFCLQKYGPRKSVDVVVSFSCVSCLICVIFTCFMVVNAEDQFTVSIYVWESMLWLLAVGSFLLRFMVLGSKTNQKFRNLSILTTEQVSLKQMYSLPLSWKVPSFKLNVDVS